jgi:RNA polymerase primary sigma factor
LGLLHAISAYDSHKSTATFRTLAFAWIRGALLMAIWRNERFIHLPFDKVRALRQMNTVNTRLLLELGREPTVAETAQAMGVKENDIWELLLLQEQQVISLQAFPTDDDDLSIEEQIPDPTTSAPAHDRFSSLDAALECLPERERMVVKLRYGFHDGQPYSQKEVASLFGIALSTVAALDRRAQMRLRRVLSA